VCSLFVSVLSSSVSEQRACGEATVEASAVEPSDGGGTGGGVAAAMRTRALLIWNIYNSALTILEAIKYLYIYIIHIHIIQLYTYVCVSLFRS
jgi:hypothetical protein